jgi:hypothetical protein
MRLFRFSYTTAEQTPCRTSANVQNTPIYSTNAPASDARNFEELRNKTDTPASYNPHAHHTSTHTDTHNASIGSQGSNSAVTGQNLGPKVPGSRPSSWLPENQNHHPGERREEKRERKKGKGRKGKGRKGKEIGYIIDIRIGMKCFS